VAYRLATVEGVPREHGETPIAGSGLLALVWEQKAEGGRKPGVSAADQMKRLEIREISAISGRVMYEGPVKGTGPLSWSQFQALAAMLIVVMIAVILFVLRAEPDSRLRLPKGVAPADPLRRSIGAMLDFVPGVVASAAISGIPVIAVLNPLSQGSELDLAPLGLALGLAAAHCTIGEWLWGRSFGKALSGCHVASVRFVPSATPGGETEAQLGRVSLWQAAVRNAVRWGMPAVGLFVLWDASRRHPGDAAARTLVVMAAEEDEETKEE